MIIYGKNTVLEALRQKRKIMKIVISDKQNNYYELIKPYIGDILIETISLTKMNSLYEGNHQGIVAYVEEYQYQILEEMIQKNENKTDVSFIVLDGLEDPHNLGAILRTADATGMDGIIIPKNRSVSLNSTVAKVSTGAIEHVDVAQVTNLVMTLKTLKKAGYWVIGLEIDGSVDYKTQDYSGKIALVIGSEGKGISRLVKEMCDYTVNIPMEGHVNSLNASVSASILFYEILRSREGKNNGKNGEKLQ